MKKIVLSLLLFCLDLFSFTACVDTSRQPEIATSQLTGVYAIELWSEHEFYEFGEPVNLRATLTNVSTDTITFEGKSGTTPVLDINVRAADWPGHEERIWSKENLNQVKHLVTLAPQESYIITWTLSLSFRTSYAVEVLWIDPREGEQLGHGTGIRYGDRPLMP